MSMDNYIYVEKIKPNKYRVWDCTASETVESHENKCLDGQKSIMLKEFKSFESAVRFADKQESEYGVSLKLWAK